MSLWLLLPSVTDSTMLTATRAFVIEEEALVALDIQDVLMRHGATEVLHFRNVDEAARHAAQLQGFTLAIVEARLGAAEVVAFTRELSAAGIGTVVMSADQASADLFPGTVPLAKPFDATGLVAACVAAGRTR